ncbi:hypothetical protein MKEN_00001900 [Mycena kentingensis (nom. inval.)]|nr:hypothetical protein MKEN_00001900 [Mycena kentingensis (nom. inval.)]
MAAENPTNDEYLPTLRELHSGFSFAQNGHGDDSEVEVTSLGDLSPSKVPAMPLHRADFPNDTPRRANVAHMATAAPPVFNVPYAHGMTPVQRGYSGTPRPFHPGNVTSAGHRSIAKFTIQPGYPAYDASRWGVQSFPDEYGHYPAYIDHQREEYERHMRHVELEKQFAAGSGARSGVKREAVEIAVGNGKENGGGGKEELGKGKGTKARLNSLKEITVAVRDVNVDRPFLAAHGAKTEAWAKLAQIHILSSFGSPHPALGILQ